MNAQSVGHIFWAIKRTALYVGRGETHLANPYNQVTGHSNGISFHDYKRVIYCLRNIYSNYSSLLWIKSGRQYYCSQENSRKMVPSGRPFWGGRICSGSFGFAPIIYAFIDVAKYLIGIIASLIP